MSEVLEDDLEEVYQFAIDLAKSSGKILLEGLERRRVTEDDCAPEVIEKLNAVDIVTQTDTGTYAFGPELVNAHNAHSQQMSKHSFTLQSRAGTRNTPFLGKRHIPKAHRRNISSKMVQPGSSIRSMAR